MLKRRLITALHDFPGITPEILLVLKGHYIIHYQGKSTRINHSKLYSFIHQRVILDMSHLESFIIINFKSRALSSLLPFVLNSAQDLMASPIRELDTVFGKITHRLTKHLKEMTEPTAIVNEIDAWLKSYYQSGRGGFLAEIANELSAECSPKKLQQLTGYSYSTLERHFKRDTGLTPKNYQSLQRFRLAVNDIYTNHSRDWSHYVHKYGYYDQSHFIKDNQTLYQLHSGPITRYSWIDKFASLTNKKHSVIY